MCAVMCTGCDNPETVARHYLVILVSRHHFWRGLLIRLWQLSRGSNWMSAVLKWGQTPAVLDAHCVVTATVAVCLITNSQWLGHKLVRLLNVLMMCRARGQTQALRLQSSMLSHVQRGGDMSRQTSIRRLLILHHSDASLISLFWTISVFIQSGFQP